MLAAMRNYSRLMALSGKTHEVVADAFIPIFTSTVIVVASTPKTGTTIKLL